MTSKPIMRRFVRVVGLAALVAAAQVQGAQPSQPAKASLKTGAIQAGLAQAAKEQKYLFLLLYQDESPVLKRMRESLAKAKPALAGKAIFVECAADTPEAKRFIKQRELSPYGLPLLAPLAPSAVVTRVFDFAPTVEQMRAAMLSPGYVGVVKALQARKGILLAFTNPNLADYQPCLAAINTFAGDFKDALVVVVSDPKRDKDLARECGIETPLTKTVLLIVLNGSVAYQTSSPTTKAAVAQAFETASSRGCPCCRGR